VVTIGIHEQGCGIAVDVEEGDRSVMVVQTVDGQCMSPLSLPSGCVTVTV
jgi:hypothetical protein